MLKSFLKLLPAKSKAAQQIDERVFRVTPTDMLESSGAGAFDFVASLQFVNELPAPDWQSISSWVSSISDPAAQAKAWEDAEVAWLGHLQKALGSQYQLAQHESAIVLSALESKVAIATAEFMTKTLTRIERILDGVAKAPEWGKDIMLVLEDEDSYYRYVSRYYPEDGEFAFSSGMHINFGCSHFVTFQAELQAIEPIIAHEMTHGCLGHLCIPAWLNEGLAVNTERRLCPPLGQQHTPQQLHWMHQKFWTPETVQEFWSGKSFLRPDEGNLLSYDLARILTEQFAPDWERFKAFVNTASLHDAGNLAAMKEIGADLGNTVCALFGFEHSTDWSPNPVLWENKPERGAFKSEG